MSLQTPQSVTTGVITDCQLTSGTGEEYNKANDKYVSIVRKIDEINIENSQQEREISLETNRLRAVEARIDDVVQNKQIFHSSIREADISISEISCNQIKLDDLKARSELMLKSINGLFFYLRNTTELADPSLHRMDPPLHIDFSYLNSELNNLRNVVSTIKRKQKR